MIVQRDLSAIFGELVILEFTNVLQDEVRFECVCGEKRIYVLDAAGTAAMKRHLSTCPPYVAEMRLDR